MLRRYFVALMALVLLVSLAISCAPAAPEVVTIRYSVWAPAPPNPFTRNQTYYWDKLQELTEGRIQMDYYFGGTLMPSKETMTGLKDGIADAACVLPAYHPGHVPLWNVGSLVVTGDLWACCMATVDLAEHPALKEELARWNCRYVGPVASGPYWIISTKPVKNLDDLKGLKLRALGEQAKFLSALGAVPVSMPYPEVHEAISKGTIDGAVSNWVTGNIYKLHEVAKYMYMLEVGGSGFIMAITDDTWSKISADDQKIMVDLVPDQARHYAEDYWLNGNREGKKVCVPAGVQVTPISAEDEARAKGAMKPLWDVWAEEREKEGLPGKEIMELWTNAIQKYEAISPFKDVEL